jgi:ABC-type maltose transport system permease subunit
MLRDEKLQTLPIAVVTWAWRAGKQAIPQAMDYSTQFAALIVLAAPAVLLFLYLQRWFIGSITQGSLK